MQRPGKKQKGIGAGDGTLMTQMLFFKACKEVLDEFGHDDAIDSSGVATTICTRIVYQMLVELCELVNGVVTDQSLTDKQNCIWLVRVNKLCELLHESLTALHSPSSVNQNDIVLLFSCFLKSLFGDHCDIIFVSLLVKWDIQAVGMGLELLNGT